MKTIQAIVELARGSHPDKPLAMATVVNVRGSAYRRPGARMLLTPGGRTAGMISGGCLENDARERCRRVLETGTPTLTTYDSTAPEDIVFGLGLGCNGVVEVLFEKLAPGDERGLLPFLGACVTRRQAGRIATVFRSASIAAGSRLLRWPDGSVTTSFEDPVLASALTEAFREADARRNAICAVTLPDGRNAEVLLECVTPPVSLTVFGAADDAIPVVNLAKSLGWHVTLIDPRSAYATRARFPAADAVHCLPPESFLASPQIVIAPDSLAIVMTHNFNHDVNILRALLPLRLRYLGLLGPKSRTGRLLDRLREEGVAVSEEVAGFVHGPTGLDIGAETPEEIAVSIVAEMQAVVSKRSGGALRDREAPIHDPVETPVVG